MPPVWPALRLLATSSLSGGNHSLTAVYGGDGNLAGSTSAPSAQTVSPALTSTSLVSSANPVIINQSVTLIAGVSSPVYSSTGQLPTGTVTFWEARSTGLTSLGTAPVQLPSGAAVLTTSWSSRGSRNVIATYDGDVNFSSSSSAVVTQTVNLAQPAWTSTVFTSSPNPSGPDQPVTLTAKVTSIAEVPTGAVVFFDGSNDDDSEIGSGILDESGIATLTVTSLRAGVHALTAVYFGDSNFVSSASEVLRQTVNPGPSLVLFDEQGVFRFVACQFPVSGLIETTSYYVDFAGTYDTAELRDPQGTVRPSHTATGRKDVDNGCNEDFSDSFPPQDFAVGTWTLTLTRNGKAVIYTLNVDR